MSSIHKRRNSGYLPWLQRLWWEWLTYNGCHTHSWSMQDCVKAVWDFKSNKNRSCGAKHNLVVPPVNKLVYDCAVLCLVAQSCLTHRNPIIRLFCPWGPSRQEYWRGLPCPPADPGIKPRPSALQADCYPSEPLGWFQTYKQISTDIFVLLKLRILNILGSFVKSNKITYKQIRHSFTQYHHDLKYLSMKSFLMTRPPDICCSSIPKLKI